MKIKNLIEKLRMYEDYEIEAVITFQPYAGAKIEHEIYKITNISDISNASKKVILNTEHIKKE